MEVFIKVLRRRALNSVTYTSLRSINMLLQIIHSTIQILFMQVQSQLFQNEPYLTLTSLLSDGLARITQLLESAKDRGGGTRSWLLYEAVRVVNEFKPGVFVAENVLGLLSVNEGIDIVESLRVLSYLNESCPQYDIEMQLFNSRSLLAQNRERLLFVGHLRTGRSSYVSVLPITERDQPFNEIEISERLGANITPLFTVTMPESTRRSIAGGVTIRDLTNIEYERLQGLPDNWTKYGLFPEIRELSKGKRYKLCGNGVSVPIIKMIATKLRPIYQS